MLYTLCGWGTNELEREHDTSNEELEALSRSWGVCASTKLEVPGARGLRTSDATIY